MKRLRLGFDGGGCGDDADGAFGFGFGIMAALDDVACFGPADEADEAEVEGEEQEALAGAGAVLAKLVGLLDLPGDARHLGSTPAGLVGAAPHCAMLVGSCGCGADDPRYEHWELALALGLPVFVVLAKADLGGSATRSW